MYDWNVFVCVVGWPCSPAVPGGKGTFQVSDVLINFNCVFSTLSALPLSPAFPHGSVFFQNTQKYFNHPFTFCGVSLIKPTYVFLLLSLDFFGCVWVAFVCLSFVGVFFENNTFFAALWFVCAYCTNTLIKFWHTFPHLVFPREDPPLECISHNSAEGCECQVNHSFQKCVGRGREQLSVSLLHITYLNFLCLPSPPPSCRVQRRVFQCFLFL